MTARATRRHWARRLLILLAFLIPQPALALPSQDEFTRSMAERLRIAFPGRTIEIAEPLQLRVLTEPDPTLVNVGRLYNFCANATAEECEASIAQFVTGSAEAARIVNATITREQLRIVVRNVEYCEWTGSDRPSTLIYRPYLAGLCAAIMADFPDTIRAVPAEDLAAMGLTTEAAWTLAERQTLAELPSPETLEGLGESVILVSGYDYVTSLLLNAEGWRRARERYGDLLVAVPASDTVVVARAAVVDADDLQTPVTRHFETAERGISPILYRFGPEGWTPAR